MVGDGEVARAGGRAVDAAASAVAALILLAAAVTENVHFICREKQQHQNAMWNMDHGTCTAYMYGMAVYTFAAFACVSKKYRNR